MLYFYRWVLNLSTTKTHCLILLSEPVIIMQKNKKIFLALFVLFMLVILYVSYDISRRTTFPGSKGNLKERISKEVDTPKKWSERK